MQRGDFIALRVAGFLVREAGCYRGGWDPRVEIRVSYCFSEFVALPGPGEDVGLRFSPFGPLSGEILIVSGGARS